VPLRVLVYTRTTGYRHDSIPAAVAALRTASAPAGGAIEVTASEDPQDVARCARFDVVAFVSTTGDVLDAAGRDALRSFVDSGGGFVGVHSAAATEMSWDWYGELLGARFSGHPEGLQNAVAHPSAHPTTAHLPRPWRFRDEWYAFHDVRDDLEILLEVDESSYAPGTFAMPGRHVQAWCRGVGAGRSWYTGLGHADEAWTDEALVDHVVAGLRWAAG
jgi:uncharacterized protein